MLLATTYFTSGPTRISGLGSLNDSASISDEVTDRIKRWEPVFLKTIFGRELYLKYISENGATADPGRWKDLRDGVDYVDLYGRNNHWDGLLRSATKESAIANYVFFKYIEEKVSDNTSSGEQVNETENATKGDYRNKAIPCWNQMVKWNKEMNLFMRSYRLTGEIQFPEYRSWGLGYLNPVDYNLEPDTITPGFHDYLSSSDESRKEFNRLFTAINRVM